jgi:YfiH family protein
VFCFRTSAGPAELAFTDRVGGVSAVPFDSLNLAFEGDDDRSSVRQNLHRVLDEFAPGHELCDLHQVHGDRVAVVDEAGPEARPDADALVTRQPGVVLMVRAADCVPVLFVASDAGAIGAAHCGRLGLVAGIVPRTVDRLRSWGASSISAWIGPHICGQCYEVPSDMQRKVAAVVPASRATTSWGTPSLDLGAGVTSQLAEAGVTVSDVSRCTRESPDLYSYRRDGSAAGRQAGLVRLRDGSTGW